MARVYVDVSEYLNEVSTADLVDELNSRKEEVSPGVFETVKALVEKHHSNQITSYALVEHLYVLCDRIYCK